MRRELPAGIEGGLWCWDSALPGLGRSESPSSGEKDLTLSEALRFLSQARNRLMTGSSAQRAQC